MIAVIEASGLTKRFGKQYRGGGLMACAHVNSKGQTFYLHQRDEVQPGGRVQRVYVFACALAEGAIDSLPAGYVVLEDPKTGRPYLAKG